MIGVNLTFTGSPVGAVIATDVVIGAGASASWNFSTDNNVILAAPFPTSVLIELSFQGFTTPVALTLPIAAYTPPVPGGFAWPSLLGSLAPGEYWSARSAVHGPAGGGVQLFAYDMDVVAFDPDKGDWSALYPGTSGAKNQDYRVWGKPVFAMADGNVSSYLDGQPTNPSPPADLSPPVTVEGNHFYIQHGADLVLYAHLQPMTLAQGLKSTGAVVHAGDFLGLAGNSGNSTNPHLHLHAIRGTAAWAGPPRPILFHTGIGVIGRAEFSSPPETPPWVDLAGRGIPAAEWSLIWPSTLPPDLKRNVNERAIDPLALILRGETYVRLTLPDPPPIDVILPRLREAMRRMTGAERESAIARARKLGVFVKEVEKVLGKGTVAAPSAKK
jgi:murein DD-endopeptidase MepM/ murein hydrolase activator NlpD